MLWDRFAKVFVLENPIGGRSRQPVSEPVVATDDEVPEEKNRRVEINVR